MSRARWILVAGAVLSMIGGCSGSPTAANAQAGTVTLRLKTPRSDDGAVVFEVSGAPMESVMAADETIQLFTRRSDDSRVIGVVVGDIHDGALVSVQVPDVGATTGYVARVIEVADRRNALRSSLDGYTLTIDP